MIFMFIAVYMSFKMKKFDMSVPCWGCFMKWFIAQENPIKFRPNSKEDEACALLDLSMQSPSTPSIATTFLNDPQDNQYIPSPPKLFAKKKS